MIGGPTRKVRRHVSCQWRSLTNAATTGFGNIAGITGSIARTGRRRSRSASHSHSNSTLNEYSTLLDNINASDSFASTGFVDVEAGGSGISASWAVIPLEDTTGTEDLGSGYNNADANITRNPFSIATSTSISAPSSPNARHRRMTTNPSHILIARGSRGHNPSAALSSPTETHAAASGIFRNNHRDSRARRLHHHSQSISGSHATSYSAYGQAQAYGHGQGMGVGHGVGHGTGVGAGGAGGGIGGTMSGQWVIEESEADSSEKEGDEMSDAPTEDVELDPTFTREGRFPGTVKIVVEGTTFWAHREILVFASPFFEAALSGDWSETRNVDEREVESESSPSILSNSNTTLTAPTSTSPFATTTTNNNNSGVGVGRRHSIASSIITIPQPPSNPRDRATKDVPTGISCSSSLTTTATNSDHDESADENENADDGGADEKGKGKEDDGVGFGDVDVVDLKNELDALNCKAGGGDTSASELEGGRYESLDRLVGKNGSTSIPPTATSATFNQPQIQTQAQTDAIARVKKKKLADTEAKIVLKEEKAAIFHDFLKFVYPHLECSITWNNVEGLMNISSKLCVPALTKQCLTFLLTHAAGKPIKAMRIAELFEEDHLYRESSRFVLDNPGGWSEAELSTLSQETLLKLEKRRNWFLERVLKLGLVNVAKEYQCCTTCPDPPTCARLLDERWRAAYNSCFRFGPCQPSMVYRYLRGLEGVTPPLQLTHLNCQNHAKAFTTTLFDRMFSLGVRGSGSGADPAPLGARVPGVQGPAPGPRRHFLYCSLNP